MKDIEVSLLLTDIKILNYNINFEEIESLNEKIDRDKLKFKTSSNFEIILEEELIKIAPEIILEYDAQTCILGSFKCKFEYHVIGLKNVIKVLDEEKKTIEIPDNILLMLLGSSLSTIRGILFAKNAGTPLENFYYPIIDPKSFLPISTLEKSE